VLHPCQIALKIPGHARKQHELAFDSQKRQNYTTNRMCMKPGTLHLPTLYCARVPAPHLVINAMQMSGFGIHGIPGDGARVMYGQFPGKFSRVAEPPSCGCIWLVL
jgi:hypothetical protein